LRKYPWSLFFGQPVAPSNFKASLPIKFNFGRRLLLLSIVLFFGVFQSIWIVFFIHYLLFNIMSEQKVQDENSVATEQNSMVQRIALEVKRREPSSVS
jgi:hypothetical protein